MKCDVQPENLEKLKESLLDIGRVREFLLVSQKKRFTNWGQIVAKYKFFNLMVSLSHEGYYIDLKKD